MTEVQNGVGAAPEGRKAGTTAGSPQSSPRVDYPADAVECVRLLHADLRGEMEKMPQDAALRSDTEALAQMLAAACTAPAT